MNWNNILSRAAWTFIQAFTSATAGAVVWDVEVWKAAAVAGLAALLSLIKTIATEQLANQGV